MKPFRSFRLCAVLCCLCLSAVLLTGCGRTSTLSPGQTVSKNDLIFTVERMALSDDISTIQASDTGRYVYTFTSAQEDALYADLILTLTNTGEESCSITELLSPAFQAGDTDFDDVVFFREIESGTRLEVVTEVGANETLKLHCAFAVDPDVDPDSLSVTLDPPGWDSYRGDFRALMLPVCTKLSSNTALGAGNTCLYVHSSKLSTTEDGSRVLTATCTLFNYGSTARNPKYIVSGLLVSPSGTQLLSAPSADSSSIANGDSCTVSLVFPLPEDEASVAFLCFNGAYYRLVYPDE